MQIVFARRTEDTITWPEFLGNDTFFPVQIQQTKREQFQTLQQGNLSVLEYQMWFMTLSIYAPYVVTNNAMMVEYFIRGWRSELQNAQSPGISNGKAPSGASSSYGFAKWGNKLKKKFIGRGSGRQQGFQQGVQQGRGFRPAPEESQQSIAGQPIAFPVEEGDLLVTNEKDKWTEDDKKKISLNCKAKSILCCALSKKEFNRISSCKSAMEMWEKLRITYEGTDKVKETRIDILVTKYERFQMQQGESITQMYSRFTDITNGLAGLGKTYQMGDMVRKILRSLPASWTPKVTAIEEANDLKIMSLEKLIGSLIAHEINMERLRESSSRKKHSNASRQKKMNHKKAHTAKKA
ncbi:hypothetical protein Taro_042052 [Colocasia esculenta]|uniref:Gag protein n=1 Tax=Colocasia esculenta TaxID=4460 RepID=A0A843WNG4_COLES|nr:hypothetical protein [Colocasia esculenta]